jgi:hypothetical protein
MKIENCIYSNLEKTHIDCLRNGLPFTASLTDPEQYGVDLYNAIVNGEHGEVADFVPYTPTQEELAFLIRSKRDLLLSELDVIVSNPIRWNSFTDSKKQEFIDYRQLLLDMPQQLNFPFDVVYPNLPFVGD